MLFQSRVLAALSFLFIGAAAVVACGTSGEPIAENAKNDGTTGDDTSADDSASDDSPNGNCDEGETKCSGKCVNTEVAQAHCGKCGNACDVDSQCVDGACVVGVKDDGGTTSVLLAELPRIPAYLQLVMDASGSMSGDKWDAQTVAVMKFIEAASVKADKNLGLGLIVFGDTGVSYPRAGKDIGVGYVDNTQFTALTALVTASSASGSTPTKEALAGAYTALSAFSPVSPLEAKGNKFVVLLSDGSPNDETGIQKSVVDALTLSAPNGPIRTFTVGVGLENQTSATTFMGTVAKNGGTGSATCVVTSGTAASACFYPVDVGTKTLGQLTQAFEDTLEAIRLRSLCEFSLAGVTVPKNSSIVFKDSTGKVVTVPQDPLDGWMFDKNTAPTKIALNGAACAQLADRTVNLTESPRGE